MTLPTRIRRAAPPRRRPHVGTGSVILGLGLVAVGAALAGRAARRTPPRPLQPEARQRALGRSRTGTAILSFSVLADSAMEHYRGGFHHGSMFAAPTTGALSLAAAMAEPERGAASRAVMLTHTAALAVGTAGMAYHLRNVSQRPGGICWNNLFYAAPLGAPGSLATAGLLGAVTHAMATSSRRSADGADLRHGRQLAALSAVALLGETAEVALLHFRGAFHDPFMYLPVTIPPAAAVALLVHAAHPEPRHRAPVRRLLQAVNALGVIGTGFHIMGVARNMGGWRNYTQMALQGPPTPAPISFTGLGLSGLAALDLLDIHEEGRR